MSDAIPKIARAIWRICTAAVAAGVRSINVAGGFARRRIAPPVLEKMNVIRINVGVALLVLMTTGCRNENVRVYYAPPDDEVIAPAAGEPLRWTVVPENWKERPAGGMRFGSFSIEENGRSADVSIIPLSGSAGTLVANVNRWRDQLGLEPVDEAAISELGRSVEVDGHQSTLFDLAGTPPGTNEVIRTLAVVLPAHGQTWFFKMTGPDVLVQGQRKAFEQFLGGIHLHGSGGHDGHLSTANLPDVRPDSTGNVSPQTPSTQPSESASTSPPPGIAEWQVPDEWRAVAPRPMVMATFDLSRGGEKAELAVTVFPGDVGGLHANVNRWRRQLGLQPMAESEVESVSQPITVGGGEGTLVELNNPNAEAGGSDRMLVAIAPHAGRSWFFKVTGQGALIEVVKPEFMRFIDSIRFSNGAQ